MSNFKLKDFLNSKVTEFNNPSFITHDPIIVPHKFTKKQDIEISGFFAATLAWGLRKTIIQKCEELLNRMDNAPHDFVLNHTSSDLKRLLGFKHRTFNDTDLLYFVEFFKQHYSKNESLENAFCIGMTPKEKTIEKGLINFRNYFFSLEDFPERTKKHIATPELNSACKRINMYLRWMVRTDYKGVDFGIWKEIKAYQLVCPIDVHVERVARNLGLIERKQCDWKTALQLTETLKTFDEKDPAKYDFALFGIGVSTKT